MNNVIMILSFCGLAYLCGSIPFAKFAGWYYGIDIQKKGSGNIGFANTVRVLGWPAGCTVLLADSMKGFLPVALAAGFLSQTSLAVVGFAAIVGHIFPVWLKFRGGKGIATGLGVTLALQPTLALFGIGVYLIVILLVRKSAPASVTATWSVAAGSLLTQRTLSWYFLGLAVLATWTHRENIRQLTKKRIVYDD